MLSTVLLEKVHGGFSPQAFESLLQSTCKGLKVRVKVRGVTAQGWVQTEVEGEDEVVALQLLSNEFGSAPVSVDGVQKFSILRGRIFDSGRTTTCLRVDVGVFTPKVAHAEIPLAVLQMQLADGKKVPLQRLTEFFCLFDYMPLHVKIVDANVSYGGARLFCAELSEHQLAVFADWLRSSLDRLVVLGARFSDVERAVEGSRHFRDVVRIESLGWLEYAVVCKLGTDAVGLIPSLGRFLRTAVLAPFSPRRIRQVVDRTLV